MNARERLALLPTSADRVAWVLTCPSQNRQDLLDFFHAGETGRIDIDAKVADGAWASRTLTEVAQSWAWYSGQSPRRRRDRRFIRAMPRMARSGETERDTLRRMMRREKLAAVSGETFRRWYLCEGSAHPVTAEWRDELVSELRRELIAALRALLDLRGTPPVLVPLNHYDATRRDVTTGRRDVLRHRISILRERIREAGALKVA